MLQLQVDALISGLAAGSVTAGSVTAGSVKVRSAGVGTVGASVVGASVTDDVVRWSVDGARHGGPSDELAAGPEDRRAESGSTEVGEQHPSPEGVERCVSWFRP